MIREDFKRGILHENPLLVLALGLCPAVAVSTSLKNGLGMGLATMGVLLISNAVISVTRTLIAEKVRIPCYILIIATIVTITDLFMETYVPQLRSQLGIFIPLLVVNCIILGRAEAFAAKNPPGAAIVDALVMGSGFVTALSILSGFREILGSNKIWGHTIVPGAQPMTIFILAPGGFIALGLLMGALNALHRSRGKHA